MRHALCLPSLVIALLTALPAAAADPVDISHRVRALVDWKLEAELLERSQRRIDAALEVQFAEQFAELLERSQRRVDAALEVQFAEFLERSQRRVDVALQLEDPRHDSIGSGVEATTLAGLSPDGGAPVPARAADPLGYLGGFGRAAEESASDKGSADLATRMTCAVTDSGTLGRVAHVVWPSYAVEHPEVVASRVPKRNTTEHPAPGQESGIRSARALRPVAAAAEGQRQRTVPPESVIPMWDC